jgi:hypothetical protein
MLQYAVPFLITNTKHPARHPISIEEDPNMTIEQLRQHILTVASRKYVIKTKGNPPQVKYTHNFLAEFNTTAIVDSSDTGKRLSQKEGEIADDKSMTVGNTTNLLEAFKGSLNLLETSPEDNRKPPAKPKININNQKPIPTTMTSLEKISSVNLISPPAINHPDKTVTKTPAYQPKKLQFAKTATLTAPIESQDIIVDVYNTMTQVDTQLQAAADNVGRYMSDQPTQGEEQTNPDTKNHYWDNEDD